MKINFDFELDQKVKVEKTGLTGIVSMCAIEGNPEYPDVIYYVKGIEFSDWYAGRLLKEAE
jgi:hypothetical protein